MPRRAMEGRLGMGHHVGALRRIGAAAGAVSVAMLLAAPPVMAAEREMPERPGASGERPRSDTAPPHGGEPDRRAKPRALPERDQRPSEPDYGGCPYRKRKLDLIV